MLFIPNFFRVGQKLGHLANSTHPLLHSSNVKLNLLPNAASLILTAPWASFISSINGKEYCTEWDREMCSTSVVLKDFLV